MKKTTIAAISTPVAPGGIGIVRLSGEESLKIVEKMFVPRGKTPLSQKKTHTLTLGRLKDPKEGIFFDEVLVSVMKGPNSYTGEDICEINCHGGVAVCTKALEICLEQGASLAEPGEFSKRAFLNGKMDLTQAEAVIDIINASYDTALIGAAAQVEGHMGEKISALRQRLIFLNGTILSLIEYPEETDLEDVAQQEIFEELENISKELKKLYDSYQIGKIIKEGIQTVILGRPNVGKSSLLNALSGFDRAIVTEIAGTTRDVLTEQINVGKVILNISDTAGVRESQDFVEQAGVKRSLDLIDQSSLILFVVDQSQPLQEEDIRLMEKIKDKNVILILNKSDLEEKIDHKLLDQYFRHQVLLSAKTGEELSSLQKEINEMFFYQQGELQGGGILTNLRQRECVKQGLESLQLAKEGLKNGFTSDLATIDIEEAVEALGQLTGESASEDTIHNIFSRFCLGK